MPFPACRPAIQRTVFSPNSKLRAQLSFSGRGPRRRQDPSTATERHQAMTWAQRLKRVFRIDIEHCEHCGGELKIIACIEDPAVIHAILAHVERPAHGPLAA